MTVWSTDHTAQIVSMKLICWNVNGWAPTRRRILEIPAYEGSLHGFLKYIQSQYGGRRDVGEKDDDFVLCLQEVKLQEEKLNKEVCCMDEEVFESFWACSQKKKGYSGVGILTTVRAEHVYKEDVCFGDLAGEGRFLGIDVNGSCVIVTVYVPNSGLGKRSGSNVGDGGFKFEKGEPMPRRVEYKMAFYKKLMEFCTKIYEEGKEVILVGDFNSCFDSKDVHPAIGFENAFLPCEVDALAALVKDGFFVDVYRKIHPDKDAVYTCFDERTNARERNQGVRIDFILVTRGLVDKVRQCDVVTKQVIPPKLSDHCALFLDIDIHTGHKRDKKPISEWTSLRRKLLNTAQRSILSMFGATKRVAENDRLPDKLAKKPH